MSRQTNDPVWRDALRGLELVNIYGGTVLGCTVWSAINEPKVDHIAIIEILLAADANIEEADYPTGNERVDEVLRRHGAK